MFQAFIIISPSKDEKVLTSLKCKKWLNNSKITEPYISTETAGHIKLAPGERTLNEKMNSTLFYLGAL